MSRSALCWQNYPSSNQLMNSAVPIWSLLGESPQSFHSGSRIPALSNECVLLLKECMPQFSFHLRRSTTPLKAEMPQVQCTEQLRADLLSKPGLRTRFHHPQLNPLRQRHPVPWQPAEDAPLPFHHAGASKQARRGREKGLGSRGTSSLWWDWTLCLVQKGRKIELNSSHHRTTSASNEPDREVGCPSYSSPAGASC